MDATDNCFVYYVLCIVHCAHTALFVVLEYSLTLSFSKSLRYLRGIPYTASLNDLPPPFIVIYAHFMEYQTGFSIVFHMTNVNIENTKQAEFLLSWFLLVHCFCLLVLQTLGAFVYTLLLKHSGATKT